MIFGVDQETRGLYLTEISKSGFLAKMRTFSPFSGKLVASRPMLASFQETLHSMTSLKVFKIMTSFKFFKIMSSSKLNILALCRKGVENSYFFKLFRLPGAQIEAV